MKNKFIQNNENSTSPPNLSFVLQIIYKIFIPFSFLWMYTKKKRKGKAIFLTKGVETFKIFLFVPRKHFPFFHFRNT